MKKTVIGLRMEYLLPSLIASAAGAVCLFLPYASVGGSSVNILRVMGGQKQKQHLASLPPALSKPTRANAARLAQGATSLASANTLQRG